jgi:hypothetical protein
LPTDCHNFLIEVVTTTGILGLICFVAWLGTAANRASGPLLVAAMAIFFVELVEPLNIGVTPIAFLALGAATVPLGRPGGLQGLAAWIKRRGRESEGGEPDQAVADEAVADEATADEATADARRMTSRSKRVSLVAVAIVTVVGATLGVAGIASAFLEVKSENPLLGATDVSAALLAQRLSPYFAPYATGVVGAYAGDPELKDPTPEELRWALHATQLDPADPLLRCDVGNIYLDRRNFVQAAAEFHEALRLSPWTQQAFLGLAAVAAAGKQWAKAISLEQTAEALGGLPTPLVNQQISSWKLKLKGDRPDKHQGAASG